MPPQSLVIEQATVFDSLNRVLIPRQTIIIKDGRIDAVTESVGSLPPDAKIINGRGKFVIPGLIDAHVHLVHRLQLADMAGIDILRQFLPAGVTSIRCAGDRTKGQEVVARHAEMHPNLSPRIFLASDALDGNPFHADFGIAVTDPAQVDNVLDQMSADLGGRKIST